MLGYHCCGIYNNNKNLCFVFLLRGNEITFEYLIVSVAHRLIWIKKYIFARILQYAKTVAYY